ncbi:MAG: hypothetical protein IJ783_04910 [Kiritimatiellae bacterium]|nr:hypothetical protein [Kiritimatiellia bacterium]
MSDDIDSIPHIAALRRRCEEWNLEGREVLAKYTDAELAGIYNGLGSDGFPSWLRTLATRLSPDLEPAALVHDVRWKEADGTRESFTASNDEFKRNGYCAARARFGRADPRRYALMNRARRYGNYCQTFGWKAWVRP